MPLALVAEAVSLPLVSQAHLIESDGLGQGHPQGCAGTASFCKASPLPQVLTSISTASANSSGHPRSGRGQALRLVSTHRWRDWKGQATQADRSSDLS